MRSRTANWFICKVRYEILAEDGLRKKVTKTYVVDAVNFTDAEARIIQEMSDYISGEIEVVEIDRAVFKEIFFMDFGEKVLDNQTDDLEKAIRKKDGDTLEKVYDRSLEEQMNNTDTRWYKSKLQFITIDEKTEKEKRSNVVYLVEGCSLESARKNIDVVMVGTMIDYVIVSVSETPVIEVFEYKYNG